MEVDPVLCFLGCGGAVVGRGGVAYIRCWYWGHAPVIFISTSVWKNRLSQLHNNCLFKLAGQVQKLRGTTFMGDARLELYCTEEAAKLGSATYRLLQPKRVICDLGKGG